MEESLSIETPRLWTYCLVWKKYLDDCLFFVQIALNDSVLRGFAGEGKRGVWRVVRNCGVEVCRCVCVCNMASFVSFSFGTARRGLASRRVTVRAVVNDSKKGGGGLLPRSDLLNLAKHRNLDEEATNRVVDVAERSLREFSVLATPFLRPLETLEFTSALEQLADLSVFSVGGYPQAERKRMVFSPAELVDLETPPEELEKKFLAPVEIRGNFLFDPAKHGDFLGAISGAGIDRSVIGDIIIVGDRGAHVIVDPEIIGGLQQFVTQVRSVPVAVREIGWDQLYYSEPKKKSIMTVEKSLRIDSVGSAGFGISRTKISEEIKKGNVLLNWKEVKSTTLVKEGDMINFRGKGRVKVEAVSTTSKQKYRVQMSRYT